MQDIKKFLDAFLDSENPGVIAIKGDWGAGKTYFVTHYLQERPAIANKLVSFGSLFGLSDIEEIRRRIFPSAISAKKIREGKTTNWLQRSLGFARKLPQVSDFEGAILALDDYYSRNEFSVEDYLKWLREENDEQLLHMLQSFVQLFNPKQPNPESKSIGEKIFAAFHILCKGNSFIRHKLINNVRVSPELLDEPAANPSENEEN